MLRKSLIAGIAVLIGITVSMLDCIAMETEHDRATTYTTHNVSQDKMILESKGKDHFLVCQRRFEITSSTVMKNKLGMDIVFEGLKVPCEAIVGYYKKPGVKNTYIAVSIEVQGKPVPQPE